jgi:small GTP-binding protein
MISIDSKIELEKCKVVLVGNSGVGKTCIINNIINKEFNADEVPTLSANFINLKLKIKELNKIIDFDIWDTAGQEQYKSIAKVFYRDASIGILVYDITNEKSYEELNFWMNQLKKNASKDIIIGICGNKSDLVLNEKVDEQKARKFADSNNCEFTLTSAKNGNGIYEIFQKLGRLYLDSDYRNEVEKERTIRNGIKINKTNKDTENVEKIKKKKKFCCF